ncbi:MAG: hypothetical protein ACJ735_05740 [Actinomycetes bacterium]
MARIVVGSYMIRYPLGGMMSWVLQYLVGFHRLGHDVFFVERASWPDACFDPVRRAMTDDPSYGIAATAALLDRYGLTGKWCFVDYLGQHYGMTSAQIQGVLDSADLYIDMGVHGSWSERAERAACRVLIDGEPGFTQMKMVQRQGSSLELPPFDCYFSTGRNIGTPSTSTPDAGKVWRPLFHPVVLELFPVVPTPRDAAITTVMNWRSYDPLEYDGVVYGHKDVEFEKFIDLPRRCSRAVEIAVAGQHVPRETLTAHGWLVRDAYDVTRSFDEFRSYVSGSAAEFSVCKQGYVATRSGWFSDRSAAYLASGRPVVQQDTGFGEHLPTGHGLFAVNDVDEAALAVAEIEGDEGRHGTWAREVAADHLAADIVLAGFLAEVGL